MLTKIFLSAIFVLSLAVIIGCGENVPPKGSLEPAKPVVPSAKSPPPPPPAPTKVPEESNQGAETTETGTVIEVGLLDANADYQFDPSDLNFGKGDIITFKLTSGDEFHSFTADSLGIDVEVEAGDTQTVTYTFNDVGIFDFICIPHETLGMVGKITVK